MPITIESGPVIELDIDVSGGKTIVCNITGLYDVENFLQLRVVEGLYKDGESTGPFSDWSKRRYSPRVFASCIGSWGIAFPSIG